MLTQFGILVKQSTLVFREMFPECLARLWIILCTHKDSRCRKVRFDSSPRRLGWVNSRRHRRAFSFVRADGCGLLKERERNEASAKKRPVADRSAKRHVQGEPCIRRCHVDATWTEPDRSSAFRSFRVMIKEHRDGHGRATNAKRRKESDFEKNSELERSQIAFRQS